MFLVLSLTSKAQDTRFLTIDDLLDRYELLCGVCMDLKARSEAGENVSKAEAQVFISRFLSCNKDLKARLSEMSAMQSRRFSSIGRWFSTGERPDVIVPPALPEMKPLLSVCRTSYGPGVATPPVVEYVQEDLLPEEIAPVTIKNRFYLLASVAAPDVAYGIMAGYRHRRWGGYMSFRSNFIAGDPSYECMSDGSLSGAGSFWTGGEESESNLSVCAGCVYGLSDLFSIYAGAGYGWRTLMWKDIDGEWAMVSDWSHKGIAAEAGLVVSFRHLAISAGISSVFFKTASFVCGLGFCF